MAHASSQDRTKRSLPCFLNDIDWDKLFPTPVRVNLPVNQGTKGLDECFISDWRTEAVARDQKQGSQIFCQGTLPPTPKCIFN